MMTGRVPMSGGDEVSRRRHLALVPDVDPGVREEVPHLQLEHLIVDVDVAMDLGRPHEGGERFTISERTSPSKTLRTRPFAPRRPGPVAAGGGARGPARCPRRRGRITGTPGEYYGPSWRRRLPTGPGSAPGEPGRHALGAAGSFAAGTANPENRGAGAAPRQDLEST